MFNFIHKEIKARNINIFPIYFTNTNYDLFNNAFSTSDCVVSNGGMI